MSRIVRKPGAAPMTAGNRVHRHRRRRDAAVDAALDSRVNPRRAFDQHGVVRPGRPEIRFEPQRDPQRSDGLAARGPAAEFANVAGRAGRAFVDVEGLVVHILWESTAYGISNWERLVREAEAPAITSGILELTITLFNRLEEMTGISTDELIEHVTGQDAGWDFIAPSSEADLSEIDWERDLASLDSAVLALRRTLGEGDRDLRGRWRRRPPGGVHL